MTTGNKTLNIDVLKIITQINTTKQINSEIFFINGIKKYVVAFCVISLI